MPNQENILLPMRSVFVKRNTQLIHHFSLAPQNKGGVKLFVKLFVLELVTYTLILVLIFAAVFTIRRKDCPETCMRPLCSFQTCLYEILLAYLQKSYQDQNQNERVSLELPNK